MRGRLLQQIVLTGVVVLAALAQSAAGGSHAPQQTIVLSGFPESAPATATLRSVLAAFAVAHPGIHVEYRPLVNYTADIEASFEAGDPPDVFYSSPDITPDWIARGFVQPLGGFVKQSGFDTSHFLPVLLHAFDGPGGRPYGLPKDWSPLAMYTNDALLSRAGVGAPSTWAELRSAAQQIRAATGTTPICVSADWARLLAFVEQNGGSFLDPSRTSATIDSAAAKAAVEFYVGLVRDGLAALPGDLGESWCGQAFADGGVAIAFEGNWLLPVLRAAVPGVQYSVHPLLANVRRGNLAFIGGYAMAASSAHKQAAWELLSYLTGRQGMQLWIDGGVALPSRDDVAPLPGSDIFLGEAPISTVWRFAPGFEDVINLANSELAAVFAGAETIDGMLAAIQSAADGALAGETSPG